MLVVVVTPLYPNAPVTDRETAYAQLSRVGGFQNKVYRHPSGACAIRDIGTRSFALWKLSIYGHLFSVEVLMPAAGTHFHGGDALSREADVYPFSWIVGSLCKLFRWAGGFLQGVGFVGDLQVEATLRNVANRVFAGGQDFLATKLSSVAPNVPANTVVTASELQTRECLSDIFYQLLWPFLPNEDIATRANAGAFVEGLLRRM